MLEHVGTLQEIQKEQKHEKIFLPEVQFMNGVSTSTMENAKQMLKHVFPYT
jgi:hypothetical protein